MAKDKPAALRPGRNGADDITGKGRRAAPVAHPCPSHCGAGRFRGGPGAGSMCVLSLSDSPLPALVRLERERERENGSPAVDTERGAEPVYTTLHRTEQNRDKGPAISLRLESLPIGLGRFLTHRINGPVSLGLCSTSTASLQ